MTAGNGRVPTVEAGWLLGSARTLQRDQLGAYLDAMKTYGDHVRFRVGPARIGFTFDAVFRPEGAQQVLASREYRYLKDAPVYEEFAHMFGYGLAAVEGDVWKLHRRIVQPLFTPRYVAASVPQITRVSADFIAEWQATLPDGGVIELNDTSFRYALQALGRTVFGGNDVDEAVPVMRAALPVMSAHATRRGLSPIRLPRTLPTSANRRAEQMRRAMYELVGEMIRRRQQKPGGEDLLSLLLAARDPETGTGLDTRQISDEALVFLVGGHETTATGLAMTLYLIGRHPEVQERIREEISEVVGERDPDAADVERLTFTTQVIEEALRLYPSLHTLVRRSADGGELLGKEVPPGQIVAVSIWGIHRNPDVWPQPDRFDPERFDPANTADRDRFAHLPFGAGPRSCIGNHLALAELIVAVATLVRAYRLESLDMTPAVEAGLTLRPAGRLPCRLSPVGGTGR